MEENTLSGYVFAEQLSQIMRLYFARAYVLLQNVDVHPGQLPVLHVLEKHDGLSQKELGDLLCVKAPTVTVMIKRMERLGMIERKHDENDQRIYRIYLTARGRKIAERVKRMVMQMEQELLFHFSETEIVLLRRFLEHIRHNLSVLISKDQERNMVTEILSSIPEHNSLV